MAEDDGKDKPKTFTQEELDRHIADRLKREREQAAEKTKDYEELKAKAAKLDEAEAKSKTETEKLAARIDAAERKAAEAEKRVGEVEAEALRLKVAADKGLTPAQAKRLQGSTREELEADADDLLETFPSKAEGDDSKASQGRPAGRPREDLRGGGKPDDTPVETDPAKLAESVPRL